MLKKVALTALLLVVLTMSSISQAVTNYSFSASSGTFTALTSATTATLSGGNADEGYYNAIPIGFNFWYMGTRFTTVSASTNGWLTFGADITNASPANNLAAGGTPRPVVAPLWDDLSLTTASADVSYLTTGAAGSRIFTIQYLNVKWNSGATAAVISFQVKLYEATGKIDFIYRPEAGTVTAASASVGISAVATGAANYLSINAAGTAASSTSETNTIVTKPATGQIFSFVSPVPSTPTALTFTGISATGMTLNWADNSSNERGFVISRSTDNVTFTYVTQTAPNATSSAQTGLSYNTTYYWRVQAVTEGNFSTALSGSQVTPCVAPAAPAVVSPVNYCLNATATALSATGTNLLWGGGSGSVGGTANLATTTYVDYTIYNNKKTNFTTNVNGVTITSVDYFIPSYQTASGVVLSIFNSAGTVIATSTANTSASGGASGVRVTNVFNYTIAAAGTYSIGLSAGLANLGADNPVFPITESTGTVTLTGTTPAGSRMFNNIQFNASTSTAPVPSTSTAGTKSYLVTQTMNGCVSAAATIVVNVNSVNISQLPSTNQIANFPFNGNANDASANANNGTLQGAPTPVADRFGNANAAYSFNGSTQYISTTKSYTNPNVFTVSAWFKTNTTTGGKIIGFGTSQTGTSGQYDRHIYMNNAGQLYFGVYSSSVYTVSTTASYNDNNWHMVTATLSTSGMALYVDGTLAGTNTATTVAETYTGYWRVAYDNNSGWTSQPSDFYFTGTIDDVLIYDRALTASEINTVFSSAGGASNSGPVCAGATLTLSAPALSGAIYSWSGPNGFTSSQQNPTLVYNAAYAGTFSVTVTVNGCTATSQTNVVSTATAGQWTGNTSTDWADPSNWCTGVVPTFTTNVVITSTAARQPTISSAVAVNNLTINPGATVTTTTAGTLSIAGTLTNNGTMTNSGTTVFNGTSGQQTYNGVSTFSNLTLNNTAGLLLPAAVTVNNLTLTAGVLNPNNFTIDVKGNWFNNASVAAFTGGTGSVTFTGTTPQTIGGAFETSFNSLTAGNTGSTITLMNNIRIGGNLIIGSVLDLGGFTANRISSGGTLYNNNTGYLKIGGTNTLPANYTTYTFLTASTTEYSGTNQTISAQAYGNLLFSSSAGASVKTSAATAFSTQGNFILTQGDGTSVTFTSNANLSIGGNVNIGSSTIWNGGSYTHTINGNWTNTGTYNGNTGIIVFAGANKTVSGLAASQNFNSVTVSASGVVFFDDGGLTMSGNLLTTGAGSFTQLPGGTLTMTGATATITGNSISINNLTATGSGKVTLMNSLTFTGNLSMVNATNTITGNTGTTVVLSGSNKTISGSGSAAFAYLNVIGSNVASANFSIASGLVVDGTFSATAGTATFINAATLSGRANLFTVVINGTKLQLSANATLGIANTLTLASGILDVTTSTPNTVDFNGTIGQAINPITYNKLSLSNGNTKSADAALTVNGDLNIAISTTFAGGNFIHNIYGDWINKGTFNAGTGTVRFTGASSSGISGTSITTFNELTVDKATSNTSLVLQTDANAAIVNMSKGMMLTNQQTITMTDTRTGNGIILGNIRRTHAFATGVFYAFESPNNSINFSSLSGVTTVLVSVVKGTISDFPSGAAISRQYTLNIPSGSYSARVRLHYEDDELNGNSESTMTLWRNTGSGWTNTGNATSRNATTNYVEKIPFTSINGRWTLSQPPSKFVWSGAIDEHWDKPENWMYNGAVATSVPQPTDIVEIGVETFAAQPSISTTATAKNIVLGSLKAVTLSMATGGSLTTGTITGTWDVPATHNIVCNGQTITINGDIDLSDGTNGDNINIYIGTGTVKTTGSFTQSGNANVTFTGNGKLEIGDHFDYVNGVFAAGTGTVEYYGATNQTIGNVTYYHLAINKSGGISTIENGLTVNGNLTVNEGVLENDGTAFIKGDVTIAAGATFTNNNVLHVGGNWLRNGTYDGQDVNVIFDGAGNQTISSTTFNNLEFNKPVGTLAELTGDVIMKGNLVGTSGTLDIKSFFFNRDVVGGSATISDNGTLIIAADNAPTKFANYFLANGSTVIFNGTAAQHLALPGVTYGNLTFRNSGTKILYVPVTVNNKLTIEPTAVFEAGANTITLNGDWINNGTFSAQTGTVLWNGANNSITGPTTFNNVTVKGKYNVASNVAFNDLFNVTATGIVTAPAGSVNIVKGDFTNSGDLYLLGETIFTGTQLQTLSLINAVRTYAVTITFNGSVSPVLNSTSAPQFAILNVNNTGGVNPSIGWTIQSALNVGAGASFNCGPYTTNVAGNMTNNGIITTAGTFNFVPASTVSLNFGTGFTSTGTVVFGNTGPTVISGTPESFRNVTVSNTNVAGIAPSSNWIMTGNFTVNSGATFNANTRSYTVGGNIKNLGTINKGTSLFTLNGTGVQDISSASPFHNITIDKSAGEANLLSNLGMNGQLTFISGKINTGNYVLSQSAGSAVTGAAQNRGWVNGKLQKNISTGATTQLFETGDANYYTPVNAAFANVTTSGDLEVSSVPTEHPAIASSDINATKSLNRYYSFVNHGLGFTTCDVTMNFVSSDLDAGANTANFSVENYNGSSWTLMPATNPDPASIKATGLTWMGDLACGEVCNKGTSISYGPAAYCVNSGSATPVITGTLGGTFTADAGVVINAGTGIIDLNSTPAGTYRVYYTIGSTGQCHEYRTSATILVTNAGTWTGSVDNLWSNPSNWSCGGVPAPGTDVVIPTSAARYPVLLNSEAVHDLTIQQGASLMLNGTIRIGGTLVSAGNFDASAGTVELNGNQSQTIPVHAFSNNAVKDLVLSNSSSSGIILAGAVDVYDALLFNGVGILFTTNDSLTIKSTATGTGRVGITTGNIITGKVTVERYISAHKAWRFLSIPTNTTQTVKQAWQEGALNSSSNTNAGYGIQITTNSSAWAANGFDAHSPSPAMKLYNSATGQFDGIAKTNAGTIKTALGYMVFVRGDRNVTGVNSPATQTVLRTKGELYSGSLPTINIPATKFAGLGNPYASSIDMRSIITTGLKEFFYVWDPNLGGQYGYGGYQTFSLSGEDYIVTPGNGSYGPPGSVSNYIPSGYGFFVQADSTGGSVTFNENIKTGAATGISTASRLFKPEMRVNLYSVNTDSSTVMTDGVLVNFDDSYKNDIDKNDAIKSTNSGENLALKNGATSLVVERRHTVTSQDTITLSTTGMKVQKYRFKVNMQNMAASGLTGFLKDNYLGTNTPLNMEGVTTVNFAVTSASASAAATRFKIVFNKIGVLPVTFTTVSAVRNTDETIYVNWKVENELNILKYTVERSADGSRFTEIGTVPPSGVTTYSKRDETPLS